MESSGARGNQSRRIYSFGRENGFNSGNYPLGFKKCFETSCSFVVSLNVSALDLDNDNFSDAFISLLSLHKVDPALIEIEFTESAIVGDLVTVSNQLKRMRALGVQIAIDDFGAGYSNLAYLKQVPATTLKIDQSFVRMLPNDPDDVNIIKAMINLGRQFGHCIVAEGIETEEAYDLLRGWGCNEGQGYWIARPMIPADLTTWLLSNEQRDIIS
jgi:EAL domain-containing protein (putative c-di-GMP-specific phosphodiesterase class I)